MEFKNPTEVLKKIFHHSRLDTVVPGTLTVSCYANFFPICYMNDNNILEVLDIDIMKEFARRCMMNIKFITLIIRKLLQSVRSKIMAIKVPKYKLFS